MVPSGIHASASSRRLRRQILLATLATLHLALAVAADPDSGDRPQAPMPPPGEMQRCYKLIGAGQYEAARARLEPIVDAHPKWQRAAFFLGLTYHEQQRYSEARALFERALAIDDTSPDVDAIRLHLGWALYYLGEPAEARQQFNAFLASRPDHADARFALGLLHFDADEIEAAERQLRKAIELGHAKKDAGAEGKARARLADVLVRRGDLEGARKELEAAVKLRPDAYEAYFKLSRVLQRLGDDEGAEQAREMHRTIRERVRPSALPQGEPDP